MEKNAPIYVAGHNGMVGAAIVRKLEQNNYTNIITATRDTLDLTNQLQVSEFFKKHQPHYVFLAAAKVGGILANKNYQADFIYQNIMIQTNCIHSAYQNGVKKLLFLGSSCIYPKMAPQPIKEEYLLTGALEPTNDAYAIAKIAGIKMCAAYNQQYNTNYISAMPCNLYGPGDNFDLNTSHVLPAIMRKFHDAKHSKIAPTLWGTGKIYREFLHVDDAASACIFLMDTYNDSAIINVGSGKDITIKELALLVQEVVGYKGEILWDTTKPDGTPKKLIDISEIKKLGWQPKISLGEGLQSFYQWFHESSNWRGM